MQCHCQQRIPAMDQPYSSYTSTASTCMAIRPQHHHPGWRSDSRSQQSSCSKACRLLLTWLLCLHAVQAAAAAPAPPGSRPCVACDDCVTSSCLRVCLPSCRTAPAMAEGSDLSTEQCKHKGHEAALDIATAACKLSQVSCRQHMALGCPLAPPHPPAPPVSCCLLSLPLPSAQLTNNFDHA